jgi:DNA replication factor GINS
MNLDDLRSVQSKERQKDSLQHLRDSFYADVGEYVEELKAERDRVAERADDPFSSPEVGRLTDEIETAEEVVEAIYERRMGKLVKRASLAAAGMPSDEEGLTAEEQDLFEDLVDRIERNKSHVLDVLAGEVGGSAGTGDASADAADGDAPVGTNTDSPRPGQGSPTDAETGPVPGPDDAQDGPPSGDAPAERPDGGATPDRPSGEASSVSAADVMGGDDPAAAGSDVGGTSPDGDAGPGTADPGGPQAADQGHGEEHSDGGAAGEGASDAEDAPSEDRTTVRITEDVGEILGVDDREYELTAEDVISLPETNARPLIERDAAERLE